MRNKTIFPAGFIWGAGTSAYQVEGAWEADGKGESIWDRFSHTPGKIVTGQNGDVACDHYHRFAHDILLMKELNLKSYRLSISWPRVQPQGKGDYNIRGLDFYDRIVDLLLQEGIQPFVTLYHWDLPQELQATKGGWASREVGERFAEYSAKMVDWFSDRVSQWTTFNEPWCIATLGYGNGEHAPGIKDKRLADQVTHNLLVAHGLAVKAARAAARRPVKLGIVLNIWPTDPLHPQEDAALAQAAWHKDSGQYLDPLLSGKYAEDIAKLIPDLRGEDLGIIKQPLDFLGVNYYARGVASKDKHIHPIAGSQYTATGWEIHPQSLRTLLNLIHKGYSAPPLYVTENGAAFDDQIVEGKVVDPSRISYLKEHIRQVRLAISDGVDVRGYFAWSLMDNFEWAQGFSKRFGLVYVDFQNQKRTIKDSGHWYARVAAANGFLD